MLKDKHMPFQVKNIVRNKTLGKDSRVQSVHLQLWNAMEGTALTFCPEYDMPEQSVQQINANTHYVTFI